MMTNLDAFIYGKLHEMFVELGEISANYGDNNNDPDFVAAIPVQMFRAEEHMRNAWDKFIDNVHVEAAEHALAQVKGDQS